MKLAKGNARRESNKLIIIFILKRKNEFDYFKFELLEITQYRWCNVIKRELTENGSMMPNLLTKCNFDVLISSNILIYHFQSKS